MCGIVAIINSNPFARSGNKHKSQAPLRQRELLYDMMLASSVRGTDGTGIYQVDHQLNVMHAKMAHASAYALDDKDLKAMVQGSHNASITVGHVRAATQGSINNDNCHPFKAYRDDGSYIIGVHNGTLHGWDTPNPGGFTVDSAWAMAQLATEGISCLEDMYGAFTFVWYDTKEPGKVFIARNDNRPLHLVRSKDGSTIYAASEAGMLAWLLDKHNMSVEDEVYSLDANTVVSIDTLEHKLKIEKVAEFEDAYTSYTMTPKAPASCPVPSSKNTSTTPTLKDHIITAVKDCLRRARYSGVTEKVDSPPVEMGPVDDDALVPADSSWYSVKGVDQADISRAIKEGVYGSIVNFDAVEYDSFLDSIVGEIVSPARLNSPIAYMHEVGDNEAGRWVDTRLPAVIVGARQFGDETEFVVVPMTEKGIKAMAV